MTHNSTRTKPAKPHKEYPLFAHANGQWAKKVRGRIRFFGVWADPEAALNKWNDEKDDLLAGRVPRPRGDGPDMATACNAFLHAKRQLVNNAELQYRSWHEYHQTCERIVKAFGRNRTVSDLRPTDFETLRASLAESRGAVALANEIQRVRSVFKYAFEADIVQTPVKFGPMFAKPSRKHVRREKRTKEKKFIPAADIRKLLRKASPQMKAMILLAVNGGFGGTDCAGLPVSAIDFKRGVISFPRSKTEIDRRVTLWAETITALKAAIKIRPEPKDAAHAGLAFITKYGKPWMRYHEANGEPDSVGGVVNPIALQFRRLVDKLKIHRDGVGFYSLRHVFASVAGEVGDDAAVSRIMGHADERIIVHYREWLGDEREDARLRRVTDHVRGWLFPPKKTKSKGERTVVK